MSYTDCLEGVGSPRPSLRRGRCTGVSGSSMALCRSISMQIFMLVKG